MLEKYIGIGVRTRYRENCVNKRRTFVIDFAGCTYVRGIGLLGLFRVYAICTQCGVILFDGWYVSNTIVMVNLC